MWGMVDAARIAASTDKLRQGSSVLPLAVIGVQTELLAASSAALCILDLLRGLELPGRSQDHASHRPIHMHLDLVTRACEPASGPVLPTPS